MKPPSLSHRRVRLAVFAFSVSLMLMGASPVLNPRVTKSATVHGVVPSDCDQALTTAPAPRIDVAEIPQVQLAALDLTPPPSGDLRTTLRDAQDALRRNDRPLFDANLSRARTLLASYPAGAERRAGEELLRVYEDATRAWDAQFESPFFDSASPLHARLSAYPGWSDAIRRGVLKDDRDRTFYPAAESRTFLTSIAADRLGRLGIRTTLLPTTRVASSAPMRSRTTLRPRTETARVPTKSRSRAKSNLSTRTATRPKSAPVSPDPTARRTPRVTATPAPAAPPPRQQAAAPPAAGGSFSPVPTTTTTTSAPVATTSATTTTSGPATTTTASTSSSDTVVSDTIATDSAFATDTVVTTESTVTETEAPRTEQKRSILLPTILILIGLGVLIVLFRAAN